MANKSRKADNVLHDCHPVTRALDKNSQLRDFKHYLFPGLNTTRKGDLIHDVDDAINFYELPPAIVEKPIPCLSTARAPLAETPCVGDCALKLVKDKFSWKRKDNQGKSLARKALRNSGILDKMKDDLKTDNPITKLPYIIVKLAHFASKDPDKYFDGIYNWYYGNSLATAKLNGQTCLLFAGGENMSEFCLCFYDRSSSSETVPEVSFKLKIPLMDNTPIYDIVPTKDYRSVGVRQRNYCYFLVYDDISEDITLENCLKVEKQNYPFVSMDSCVDEFCTVDVGRNLKFWTPCDSKRCYRALTLPNENLELTDSFAQIKYSSSQASQEFVVIDRNKLYLYDGRVNSNSPHSVVSPEKSIEICEQISLLVPSLIPNYWYVGLNHTCLLYDARAGFVQKWTHMLPQAPTIGSTCQINKEKGKAKECLLLGTQSTNDVVAIYNKWKGDAPTPNVLPVNVPVGLDTLHEAHSNGLLTDPSFTKRFTRSLVGMAPYKRKKKIGVFTLRSSGDIFHQCIFRRKHVSSLNSNEETKLRESELNQLKKWQTEYLNELRRKKSNLTVTRRVNFSNLAASIASRNPELPPHQRPDLSGRAVWKKSKRTLESYRDFLTPHILHDFGIDEESEWATDDEQVHVQRVDPHSIGKVQDWLTQSHVCGLDDVVDVDELFMQEPKVEEDTEDLVISMSSDESASHASRMSYGM